VYDSFLYVQNFGVPDSQRAWLLNDSIIASSLFQSALIPWSNLYYGGPVTVDMLRELDYFTFAIGDLIQHMLAVVTGFKNSLVFAGVAPANVTAGEVRPDFDIRYQVQALHNGKTFTAYIELTAAGAINNQMALVLNLHAQDDAVEVTTSYVPNAPVVYNDVVGINKLRETLVVLEKVINDELLFKAYSLLGI
jgi:hypothetical protein